MRHFQVYWKQSYTALAKRRAVKMQDANCKQSTDACNTAVFFRFRYLPRLHSPTFVDFSVPFRHCRHHPCLPPPQLLMLSLTTFSIIPLLHGCQRNSAASADVTPFAASSANDLDSAKMLAASAPHLCAGESSGRATDNFLKLRTIFMKAVKGPSALFLYYVDP